MPRLNFMTTQSMHQLLEITEKEVRSRPSAIEFEMAYDKLALWLIESSSPSDRWNNIQSPVRRCARWVCAYLRPWNVSRRWIDDFKRGLESRSPRGTGTRENQSHPRRFLHPSAVESDMIAAHTSNHRTVHSRDAARESVSGARNGKLRV